MFRVTKAVSLAAVSYDPAEFERLTEEPWDPARVESAIVAIVDDADAAFDWERRPAQ